METENSFEQKMKSMDDKQLLEVIRLRDEYQPKAAEAAIAEAKERKLIDENLTPLRVEPEQFEEIEQYAIEEKINGKKKDKLTKDKLTIAEEKIESVIKDKSKIINYCLATGPDKNPFPKYIMIILGIFFVPVCLILSLFVARAFAFLTLGWIIFIVIFAFRNRNNHILIFLEDNLRLIDLRDKYLKTEKEVIYKYAEINKIKIRGKRIFISLEDVIGKVSVIDADSSTFKFEDFDVEKFVEEKISNEKQ